MNLVDIFAVNQCLSLLLRSGHGRKNRAKVCVSLNPSRTLESCQINSAAVLIWCQGKHVSVHLETLCDHKQTLKPSTNSTGMNVTSDPEISSVNFITRKQGGKWSGFLLPSPVRQIYAITQLFALSLFFNFCASVTAKPTR